MANWARILQLTAPSHETYVQGSKFKVQGSFDVGCWVLGVGCWVLGVGCWVLDVGCWMLGVGCWMLDVGCWMLDVGCWMLDVGCWVLDVPVSFEVRSSPSVSATNRIYLNCRHLRRVH